MVARGGSEPVTARRPASCIRNSAYRFEHDRSRSTNSASCDPARLCFRMSAVAGAGRPDAYLAAACLSSPPTAHISPRSLRASCPNFFEKKSTGNSGPTSSVRANSCSPSARLRRALASLRRRSNRWITSHPRSSQPQYPPCDRRRGRAHRLGPKCHPPRPASTCASSPEIQVSTGRSRSAEIASLRRPAPW